MATYTDQQIRDWVNNIYNTEGATEASVTKIKNAADENGISLSQLDGIMGWEAGAAQAEADKYGVQATESPYTDESVNNLINYYYATEAGRMPTNADLDSWRDIAQTQGLDAVSLKTQMLDSARQNGVTVKTDTDMIKNLYKTGYGEDATPEEVAFWTNEIQQGNVNPANLRDAISTSSTNDGRSFDTSAVIDQFSDDYIEQTTGYSQDMKPFAYDSSKMQSPGYDPKAEFVFNEDDPSYQFRKDETQKAVERSQAAKGNLLSGGAVKESARYASDLASQEYGNAFNRWQGNRLNEFNMGQGALSSDYNRQLTDYNTQQNQLINLANYGQGAKGQVQQAAGQMGTQVGNSLIGTGQAQAAGAIGSGQAQANMYGNVGSSIQTGITNYLQKPS